MINSIDGSYKMLSYDTGLDILVLGNYLQHKKN